MNTNKKKKKRKSYVVKYKGKSIRVTKGQYNKIKKIRAKVKTKTNTKIEKIIKR